MKFALIQMPFWPVHSPPLGVAYIKSVLQDLNFSCDVYDFNIELHDKFLNNSHDFWSGSVIDKHSSYKFFKEVVRPILSKEILKIVKILLDKQYDVIGFTVTELSYFSSQHTAKIIKKLSPSTKIIFGGPQISATDERIIHDIENDLLLAAFIGEAEESVRDYFTAYRSNESTANIAGVITKNEEDVISKFVSRKMANYNEIPLPDFTQLNPQKYVSNALPIMMSRGCVASCSFCTEKIFWRNYRFRSADHVVSEIINDINVYGVNRFFFCDSLINGNIHELERLVDLLISKNLELEWTAFCRVDETLTKAIIQKMAKSGCKELHIGFESGSQRILDLMNKQTTVVEGSRVIKDVYNAGIKIHALFIVGFPGEEHNEFIQTLTFIHKHLKYFYMTCIGNGLSYPNVGMMAVRPEKYDVLLGEDGKVLLENDYEWKNFSGTNTHQVRQKRLKILGSYLDAHRVNWIPKKSMNDQRDTPLVQLKRIILRFYYHYKLR